MDDDKSAVADNFSACTIQNLFSDDSVEKRKIIIDKCETLMFEDFECIGKRARGVMWRKGYYEIISLAKRIWKSSTNPKTSEDLNSIKEFILDGIKNIKRIIIKFEKKFCLDLKYVIDFSIINNNIKECNCEEFGDTDIGEFEKEIFTLNEISYALETIHSLLISLGDLHRYYIDFDQKHEIVTSELVTKYYIEAFKLNSNIGMAQNQLGTLASGQNYELTSIYHYMFSLMCQTPFELSENNLIKIFHDNSEYLNEKKNTEDELPEIKDIVANLILVLDIFFFDKEVSEFNALCRNVLLGFKCLINMRTGANEEMLFNIVASFLFCLYKLNLRNSKKVHSLNAFLLAICSVLIDGCIENIEQFIDDHIEADELFREYYNKIFDDFEKNVRETRTNSFKVSPSKEEHADKLKPVNCNENEQCSNNSGENIKSKKKVRRRRKCRTSSNDESELSSNEEDNSDNSDKYKSDEEEDDNDDNSMTSFDSYDDDEDNDDDDEDEENGINHDSDHSYFTDDEKLSSDKFGIKKQGENNKENVIGNLSNLKLEDNHVEQTEENNDLVQSDIVKMRYRKRYNKMDPNLVLRYVENEKLLKSLKILFDWLHMNNELLIHCYSSNPEFIHKIIKFVNYLNIDIFTRKVYFPREFIKVNGLRDNIRLLFDDRHHIAVDEDNLLKKFRLFEANQGQIDWELNYKMTITSMENAFLRLFKLIDFGFSVCKYKKFNYSFCAKTRQFIETRPKQNRLKYGRNRNRSDRNHTRNRRRNRNYKENNYKQITLEKKIPVNGMNEEVNNHEVTISIKKGYLRSKNVLNKEDTNNKVEIITEGKDRNCKQVINLSKNEIMGKLWLTSEVNTLESKVCILNLFKLFDTPIRDCFFTFR